MKLKIDTTILYHLTDIYKLYIQFMLYLYILTFIIYATQKEKKQLFLTQCASNTVYKKVCLSTQF